MLVKEIMKRDVRRVAQYHTLVDAAGIMRSQNCGFLPVCSEDGIVLGTVTDRDIVVRGVADGLSASASIGLVMTHDVISCHPDDDVREAERLMGEHRKSRILCLEGMKLVGVLSLSDIADAELSGIATSNTLRKITKRESSRPS